VASSAVDGLGDDYLLSTFEGILYGEDGDDILESRGEDIAANRMNGGEGADEFRYYGVQDDVEDLDGEEGNPDSGNPHNTE
jgi:hypothetical protein